MPFSLKPFWRSRQESHWPQGAPVGRGIVATAGQRVVDAQLQAEANDLRLGERDERSVNFELLAAFDSGFGGQVGHFLEGGDEFRTAIGIAGVVERIHADEDVAAPSTSAQASAKERKMVLRAGT